MIIDVCTRIIELACSLHNHEVKVKPLVITVPKILTRSWLEVHTDVSVCAPLTEHVPRLCRTVYRSHDVTAWSHDSHMPIT